MPHNAISKRSYNGVNVPILWHAQQENGYSSAAWLTYKQAQAAGAQVKGGEKSTRVVFAKQLMIKDDADVEKHIGMLRTFAVFNASQIEGLPKEAPLVPLTPEQRDDQAIRFIQATKADIDLGSGVNIFNGMSRDHNRIGVTMGYAPANRAVYRF